MRHATLPLLAAAMAVALPPAATTGGGWSDWQRFPLPPRARPGVHADEIRHAHEVEDREVGVADVRGLAGAATEHLRVEDRACREPWQ